ncbi:hypothetical protein PGIGA_G00187930 [Pangasianodon gigas]|uniref:Uncharacterized protein n=1 Tax=Pangasianodon gigas TaxID=30993 RepID=A0ACC5WBC5_PANGG|nr:hypothetical protein [Pangasianodon gigas]
MILPKAALRVWNSLAVEVAEGLWKFHCLCCLGFFLMIRREGKTLLDFLLRMKIAVEIKTVTKTKAIMTAAIMPRICMGFSRLFIKKDGNGPLSRVCKRAQRNIKSMGLKAYTK